MTTQKLLPLKIIRRYLPRPKQSLLASHHKTWITVNGHQYESHLMNQFDLAEYAAPYAEEPLTDAQRLSQYKAWLAAQLQNDKGLIWHEFSLLADAYEAGYDITITAFAGAVHLEVIERGIIWFTRYTAHVDDGRQPRQDTRITNASANYWMDDALLYRPRLVWVLGRTRSTIGYIYEDQPNTVLTVIVPGEGVVKIRHRKNLRTCWYPITGKLEDYIRKESRQVEQPTVPMVWNASEHQIEPARENGRYYAWRSDSLHIAAASDEEDLLNHTLPAHKLPEPSETFTPLKATNPTTTKPIYRYNAKRPDRIRILDPEKQLEGKLHWYRPARPGERPPVYPKPKRLPALPSIRFIGSWRLASL